MLQDVLKRIESACLEVGRNPGSVKLIAVTKAHDLEEIEARVLRFPHRIVGENRVQEALPKMEAHPNLEWHLIGHLQTNKVKYCQGFSAIHSVDSAKLLEEIARRGATWERTPQLFLEINTGGEAQKHGATVNEAAGLLEVARGLGLNVVGLMTVAPQGLERAREAFRALRELRDALGLKELSMGMSDDLEVAIAEGATLVRVGRAVFS
ncbi:MAG: YggS family pyridoxal phosphate-dependent enzyme [Pleurocapsa sp. SU_196_0]|nr:YggS family pyridoxal phosphate-dependent enzyme [Pleurocapsa sp. SU_196_0]